MSLHGKTKGTKFEQLTAMIAQGEAQGTMMYYALARLAKEQGLEDVAEDFIEAGKQEALHAGFYAVLSGKYPQDFWQLVRGVMAAETGGEKTLQNLAENLRTAGLGLEEAADEMEIFAKQEGHHGIVLRKILEKYKPELLEVEGKTIYVCGYEYIGDLDSESEDYICPVCGQPKKVFRRKA